MSALDPVLASGATTDQIAHEIALLATNAQVLGDELRNGAVVTANVLPPNGIGDVVEILGRRVAAELPPDLRPGDVIVVRVAGFEGDRIVLQKLGAATAEAPQPAQPAQSAPSPSPSTERSRAPLPSSPANVRAPQPAVPRPSPASPSAAELRSAIAAASRTAPPGRSAAAPSSAVFVAASIRSSPESETSSAPAGGESPAARAAAPAGRPAPPLAPRPAHSEGGLRPIAPEPRGAAASGTAVRARALDGGGAQLAAIRASVVLPRAPAAPDVRAVAPQPPAQAQAPPADFRDARRLLAAAGIEMSAERIATVRNAIEHPERLPDALRALEATLRGVDADPRVGTLRAIASFVGRLDPQQPTFASQLSAYVSHVLDGREPKLATLLNALQSPDRGASAMHAQAIGARLGLEHDLKSQIFALLADPPPGASELFPTAAAATLGALTSLQLAADAAQTPSALAFAIPLPYAHPATTAHVRFDREPAGRGGLSADDFHIGFVLSTERLGTIAIDLRTAERAVSVHVSTETQAAATTFSGSLDRLADRLRQLRYRVASIDAGVAARSLDAVAHEQAPPEPAAATGAPRDAAALVDVQR